MDRGGGRMLVRVLAALAAIIVLAQPAAAQVTQWHVRSAQGMDALLLIGAASGDVMQQEIYPDDIRWVREHFSPAGLAALQTLDHGIREQQGGLVGPNLALVFSAGPFDTLDEVIASARDPEGRLRANYQASPFWDANDWTQIVALMPTVLTALEELKRVGFEARWQTEWKPAIDAAVAANRGAVDPYDIIPEQARLLGRDLDPNIEIVILHFSEPYGIRVTGQRFLTHHSYDARIQLRTAAHEIFHPPFVLDDWRLWVRLETLRNDPWMRSIVEHHDARFGYNSFEGIVNEDSTKALEQIVSERLGFATSMRARIVEGDGGMHVLAAALYQAMKEDGFDRRGGRYSDWLISALDRGMLTPAEVRRRATIVLGWQAVERWTPAS